MAGDEAFIKFSPPFCPQTSLDQSLELTLEDRYKLGQNTVWLTVPREELLEPRPHTLSS